MPRDSQDNFRFSSGPVVRIAAGLVLAAVVALVVFAVVTANMIAIGFLVTLGIVVGIGVILERIDSSRRRQQGSSRSEDEHWGFWGRPGL